MSDPLSTAYGLPDLIVAAFMLCVVIRCGYLIKRDGLP